MGFKGNHGKRAGKRERNLWNSVGRRRGFAGRGIRAPDFSQFSLLSQEFSSSHGCFPAFRRDGKALGASREYPWGRIHLKIPVGARPGLFGIQNPIEKSRILPHPRNFGRRLLLIPGLLSPLGRVFPTGIPPLGRSREFPRSPQPRMLQSGQNSQNIPFIHSLESFGSGSYPSRSRNPPHPPGTAAPVPHLGMEKTAEKSGKNRECRSSGRPRAPRESREF